MGKIETAYLWSEIEGLQFQGVSILYIEVKNYAIVFHTRGWPQRAIEDPHYARAYEYKSYKQVEDVWGKALGKADTKFFVNVKLKSMGAIK